MKIIAIANQKGGCGKTTTKINLAAALSRNGKRTLLIDLDPQAHASLGLNLENHDSLYNVISRLTPRKKNITEIIVNVEENFDIVPSNILVGTLEQELSDEIGREVKLTEIIAKIKDQYDFILIDCPPSLGFLTINALRASDEVILPVETSRFSMQGVDHLLDIVNLIRDRLNHMIEYRILITMFDSRLRHSFSMLEQIREKFESVLCDTIIHTNVKLKESAVSGQTVIAFDKYCRGSKDYFSLAKELIMAYEPVAERAAEKAADARAAVVAKEARKAVREAVEEAAEAGAAEVSDAVEEEGAEEAARAELDERGEQAAAQNTAEEKSFQPLSGKMKEMVKEEIKDILVSVTFELKAPDARSVYVTGSFNDWSLDEECRMKAENGSWQVTVPLKEGLHKYQFIVDGRWREDPGNPRQERNSFGDINSLIEVGANG